MALRPSRPRNRDDFKVAVICALPLEAGMVQCVFDKEWDINVDLGKAQGDHNAYSFGAIGSHNIVLVHMPGMGSTDGAIAAANLRASFSNIEITFLVGICGANPKNTTQEDIFLGDCIVSTAIVQYDFGRQYPEQFSRKTDLEDALSRPNSMIRGFLAKLQATQTSETLAKRLAVHLKSLQQKTPNTVYPGSHRDRLFKATYPHTHRGIEERCNKCIKATGVCSRDCGAIGCDETQIVERTNLITSGDSRADRSPQLHFGRYGSANTVLKSGVDRDYHARVDNIIGFEMEGAGIWETTPTIIIKSACDYADSHKNKEWQIYAAATAAAGLKAILEHLATTDLLTKQDNTSKSRQVSFNIPNTLVAHFVHREEILAELCTWMNDAEDRAKLVLRGMGGAGKSQLALECCRRAEASKQFKTVLWIDASSVLSVQQSFKVLISELDGSSAVSDSPKSNVNLVTQALRKRGGRWLAVFDNFDYPNVFQHDPITNYIPMVEYGKILFTSRDATSSRLGRVVSISGMTGRESLELLLKRKPRDSAEEEIALRIAVELGHLALALDQAEAYIRSRNLPLQDFITHFRKRKKTILQEVPQQWEYQKNKTAEQTIILSAFTTWELSFEQLSGPPEMKQGKGHFLTLCAFFDPMSISKEYFEFYCHTTGNQWTSIFKSEAKWDGFLFDDVAAECRTLSLIQNDEYHDGKGSLTLHPLIREWLKLRMTSHEQQKMAEEFTDLLVSCIEAVDFESSDLVIRQRLLANVISCVQEDERFRNTQSIEYPSYDARCFGGIYWKSGFYDKAEQLYLQALTNNQEKLGLKHPDTLRAMNDVALIYDRKGRYNEAEKLYKQVLISQEEIFGLDHPDTLWTMHNLALVHEGKGRYDEAEQLYKQVLASNKRLGADTLYTTVNLAIVYEKRGSYDHAEQLYKQVLATQEKELGPKHPQTLRTMHYMASVYQKTDRCDAAEELFNQVLILRQEKLGPKHPETLETMNHLAFNYQSQKRHDNAEELYRQVLAGYREKFGPKHVETLGIIVNLGFAYQMQEKYDSAEEMYKQALAGYQEELGPEHSDTLRIKNNLASLPTRKDNISVQYTAENPEEIAVSVLEGRNQRKQLVAPRDGIREREKNVNPILALGFSVTRSIKQRLRNKS